MKTLISIALILHGGIHLMGFLKSFSLVQIEEIKTKIPAFLGGIWLAAFVLFAIAGIGYLTNGAWWRIFGAAGIVASLVVIIPAWSDAKYGIIPNIIFFAVIGVSYSAGQFQKKIDREKEEILAMAAPSGKAIEESELQDLPLPVQKWLRRAGVVGRAEIRNVWIRQKALMKLKPGQEEWYVAEAGQLTATDKPAFIWNVRMSMNPLIQIAGRDRFVNGKGAMLIKLGSLINVANEKGDKIDQGSAQRYLGEMVWYPSFALSQFVSWETLDLRSARATLTFNGSRGEGIFFFNDDGDFVRFSAMRYKDNKPGAVRYEWTIEADEYAIFDGVKVPSKLKATWKLPEGDWTWLNLEVVDIKFMPAVK